MATAVHPRINWRRWKHAIWSTANLPALLALGVIAVFAYFASYQNKAIYRQALRAEVVQELGLVRARLEGNLSGAIQLVRGLVAVVATEPQMNQGRFEELARNLVGKDSLLRNIAGAPHLVVMLMYPMEGNEKAIGLDYRVVEAQRDAAFRARDTGELVLAGPVDLIQGGRGFVGRFPVFLHPDRSPESFWGLVSAVIDADRLYEAAGLLDPELGIEIAIRGQDATGSAGSHFYGDAAIFENDPVLADVVLPFGSWRIAAVPSAGWHTLPPNAGLLRGALAIVALVIAVPLLIAGRFAVDRQRSFAKLRRREEQLRVLSRRLELALDASQIGVWEADLQTGAITWDDRLYEIYGRSDIGAHVTAADWEGAVHPDDRERETSVFVAACAARAGYASAFRIHRKDGAVRHIRTSATVYEDARGAIKMIGAEWDATDDVELTHALERAKTLAEEKNEALQRANRKIEHNALHDSLTGLPNRRFLDRRLEEIRVAGPVEGRRGAALLHIDLDRFKQINDTLGHAAGDAMLVHAAAILRDNVGPSDFVARIGGDEFVVVCVDGICEERLAALAERIIQRMRQPVAYQGHECRFGVSVGIAQARPPLFDPKRLVVNADIALYRAKSRGRNRYEFFTDALQAEIVSTKRTADEILNALERDEFLPYFQPQFDARTLEIVGVEALARWNHPRNGILGPDAFLKIAEELNVVATIDRLILEKALAEFADWERRGLNIPNISVNVSARRLQEEELVRSLHDLKIRPGTVSFELLESIFLDENDELVISNVEQIKRLGIDIEIDDFGTGYASIVSLLKLRPKRLKIDRQLVMPIVEAPAQRPLVESMIEIGRSLDIEVIAEGVETREHAKILEKLGCDMLQGYAFGGPMSAEAFRRFVARRSWRKAS